MSAKRIAYLRKCDHALPPQVVDESNSGPPPKRKREPLSLAVGEILSSIANGHTVLVTRETWNDILQALSDVP